MNFADEPYIRVMTRDTPGWKMMPWEAKTTQLFLMRKLDRAGVLDLAEYAGEEMAAVVSLVIDLPVEIVAVGLAHLLKRRTFVVRDQFLVMPKFVDAQEAKQSDRLRKAEQRARYRDRALATERGLVPQRDTLAEPPKSEPGHPTGNGHGDPSNGSNGDANVPSRDASSAEGGGKTDAVSRGATERPAKSVSGHSESSLAELSRAGHGQPPATAARENVQSEPESNADHDARVKAAIVAELERWPITRTLSIADVADSLTVQFGQLEMRMGTKLEWYTTAIGEAAFDGRMLNAQALTKLFRTYGARARPPPPDHANGNGNVDADKPKNYESTTYTKEEIAAQQERARKKSDEQQRKFAEVQAREAATRGATAK